MHITQRITPCLRFDHQAEEAAPRKGWVVTNGFSYQDQSDTAFSSADSRRNRPTSCGPPGLAPASSHFVSTYVGDW